MNSLLTRVTRFFCRVVMKAIDWVGSLSVSNPNQELALLISALKNEDSKSISLEQSRIKLLIIIPFRDAWLITQKCLSSLQQQIIDQDFQINLALVDNGSVEEQTQAGLNAWMSTQSSRAFSRLKCIRDDSPFNFSKLNNKAVKELPCTHVLFLNNDVEFTSPNQLNTWLRWVAARPDLGITGCTLLYPNRTVQHACVLPGFKIAATHPLRGASEAIAKLWASQARAVPAVTGAAMMIERELFERIGGFDEELAHALQDVDLCLQVLKEGRKNWTIPEVTLIHHESFTRKKSHRLIEVIRFQQKWEENLESLTQVSANISRWLEKVRPSWGEGKFPWRYFLHDMKP